MTGLDKILAGIREESAAAVAKTQADAAARANAILAQAQAQADRDCGEIAAAGAARVRETAQRAASAAQLEQRKRLLAARQQLVAETLSTALEKVRALPAAPYFDLLLAMAARAAHPRAGRLCLGAADLARLPDDFESRLAAALTAPASLTVSRQPAEIDGGFVLLYDDGVEENNSFAAVFAARRDELQDIVCKQLFS